MTQRVICIPARYDSSRLPGKPLIRIADKELVLWAVDSARKIDVDSIVVATDDERIFQVVENYGCDVVMTSRDHQSGTDRLAEVAKLKSWNEETIVVNYQGDEPQTPKENIEQLIQLLETSPGAAIATLFQEIHNYQDWVNPNNVKLVTNEKDLALYFSRAPIPFARTHYAQGELDPQVKYKHHIGLYAYRAEFLHRFTQLQPSSLESTESLEQLRALENGYQIIVSEAAKPMPHGIDTQEDLENFKRSL